MGEAGSGRGAAGLADRTAPPALPLTLRDEHVGDGALLRRLFETGLAAPLLACGLPRHEADDLLTHQLLARERGHAASHPLARRQIAMDGERPVGRLSVDRSAQPWYLVDLAVLPDERGRGIASELLARLQARAALAEVAVELHVAADNPALGLYLRADFAVEAEEGLDLRMRWAPQ